MSVLVCSFVFNMTSNSLLVLLLLLTGSPSAGIKWLGASAFDLFTLPFFVWWCQRAEKQKNNSFRTDDFEYFCDKREKNNKTVVDIYLPSL